MEGTYDTLGVVRGRYKQIRQDAQLIVSELCFITLPVIMVRATEIGHGLLNSCLCQNWDEKVSSTAL